MSLPQLPSDVIGIILAFLPPVFQTRLSRVSRTWRRKFREVAHPALLEPIPFGRWWFVDGEGPLRPQIRTLYEENPKQGLRFSFMDPRQFPRQYLRVEGIENQTVSCTQWYFQLDLDSEFLGDFFLILSDPTTFASARFVLGHDSAVCPTTDRIERCVPVVIDSEEPQPLWRETHYRLCFNPTPVALPVAFASQLPGELRVYFNKMVPKPRLRSIRAKYYGNVLQEVMCSEHQEIRFSYGKSVFVFGAGWCNVTVPKTE